MEAHPVNPIASSAAAKVEMHLRVPVHNTPTESLIEKPLPPLEVAAKETDKKIRVKTIKHTDCIEVGHDKFDEVVSNFLGKIGESNVINITPLNYTPPGYRHAEADDGLRRPDRLSGLAGDPGRPRQALPGGGSQTPHLSAVALFYLGGRSRGADRRGLGLSVITAFAMAALNIMNKAALGAGASVLHLMRTGTC